MRSYITNRAPTTENTFEFFFVHTWTWMVFAMHLAIVQLNHNWASQIWFERQVRKFTWNLRKSTGWRMTTKMILFFFSFGCALILCLCITVKLGPVKFNESGMKNWDTIFAIYGICINYLFCPNESQWMFHCFIVSTITQVQATFLITFQIEWWLIWTDKESVSSEQLPWHINMWPLPCLRSFPLNAKCDHILCDFLLFVVGMKPLRFSSPRTHRIRILISILTLKV